MTNAKRINLITAQEVFEVFIHPAGMLQVDVVNRFTSSAIWWTVPRDKSHKVSGLLRSMRELVQDFVAGFSPNLPGDDNAGEYGA